MGNYRKKPVVIEAVTFAEFIEYGKNNGANIVNGMPWSFSYKGHPVTHETDECYLIPTLEGVMQFTPNDMLITGVNGEIYPCKLEIFEKTYESAEGQTEADNDPFLDFGGAIRALKDGKRVARQGWNGKGMWIVMMPELKLPPYSSQQPGAKVNDRTAKHIGVDTPLNSQPYVAMWTAQGTWQPGWNASTPDILAEDWVVLE